MNTPFQPGGLLIRHYVLRAGDVRAFPQEGPHVVPGSGYPVQLGTAGVLPTQLFGALALIGELVVVMVPPTR
ncbi:hypothetical protein SAMN05216188_12157 [Lentzea xinjiangensis]|uniref:Uncharacterized protein n=1 Tax=Lentzea xinjiangensis TaxID=402600 RepID=A0A1H9UE60_9PSEU|nr:hypothetical protein SAMN05216188_12157 [Lentzea xinjiangensis]